MLLKVRGSELPFVSVIMPVRNEAEFIGRSLKAVFGQKYPHSRMEIIIADGISTDGTRDLIEEHLGKVDIPMRIIDNPDQIAPAGLNRAIAVSRGSIIIRVDGHCEIDDDYVSYCVYYLQSGKADGVGGPIETVAETRESEAIAVAMSSSFGVGGSAFRTVKDRELEVDTVAFPGYRREVFERIGGFNQELVRNQDDEFNYRLRKNGGKIILTPFIRSLYYSRSTFKSLARQYFQYGYWKVRVFQLHPRQMSLRQFVPAAFVLTLFVLLVLSAVSSNALWFFLLFSGLYTSANIIASVLVSSKRRFTLMPMIAASFAVLHFSYGIGFVTGLVAFSTRWLMKRHDETAFSSV